MPAPLGVRSKTQCRHHSLSQATTSSVLANMWSTNLRFTATVSKDMHVPNALRKRKQQECGKDQVVSDLPVFAPTTSSGLWGGFGFAKKLRRDKSVCATCYAETSPHSTICHISESDNPIFIGWYFESNGTFGRPKNRENVPCTWQFHYIQ